MRGQVFMAVSPEGERTTRRTALSIFQARQPMKL
jgi:hypothetical protein